MTNALILDCDGVLAETELNGHLVAFNQVFAERGLAYRWSDDDYKELLKVGGGKERMLTYLADHPEAEVPGGDTDAFVADLHVGKSAAYRGIVDSGTIPARPGIRRLVEEALDAGWLVAIASTSAPASVESVADAVLGPADRQRLAGIFAGDVVPAKKPAPDIYLLALRELGLDRADAVVIEDSGGGARAAAAAGIPHIVTVSHFTRDDAFPDAICVVEDLGEPGAPALLLAGTDLADERGVIGISSLRRALTAGRTG